MADYQNILIEKKGPAIVLTINREKAMNALDKQTINELVDFVGTHWHDDSFSVLIITGAGKAFVAGADIAELKDLDTQSGIVFSAKGNWLFKGIQDFPKPVIAAVNGFALGGGCELALACDIRLASEKAKFGQPEVNLGIIPGYGGTQRLPRLIGFERAAELIRTGRPVGAKEACAWGWAHGEPVADPVAAAKSLVRDHVQGRVKLAPVSPAPVAVPTPMPKVDIGHRSLVIDAILVDVVRRGLARSLSEGLAIEAAGFGRCKATVDMDIGMKNFIQNGPRVPAVFMHE